LLTAPAAARALGVHPRTLRRWIRSGRLAGLELGARCWTTAAALDALAAACGASGLAAGLEPLASSSSARKAPASARKAPASSSSRRK